jgi:hypothetical protein
VAKEVTLFFTENQCFLQKHAATSKIEAFKFFIKNKMALIRFTMKVCCYDSSEGYLVDFGPSSGFFYDSKNIFEIIDAG